MPCLILLSQLQVFVYPVLNAKLQQQVGANYYQSCMHVKFIGISFHVVSEVLSSQAPAAAANSSALATTLYPIVSVVVILLSNAVIITIMLFIFLCWTRKRNNHKNTRPDRLTVRSVHIQDNVCYVTTVPGNE